MSKHKLTDIGSLIYETTFCPKLLKSHHTIGFENNSLYKHMDKKIAFYRFFFTICFYYLI